MSAFSENIDFSNISKALFLPNESLSLTTIVWILMKVILVNLIIIALIVSIKRISKWLKGILIISYAFVRAHIKEVSAFWDKHHTDVLFILGALVVSVLLYLHQKAEEEKEKRELEELKQLVKEASKNPEIVDKVADKVIEKAYKKGYKKGYNKGYSDGRFSGFSSGMGSC